MIQEICCNIADIVKSSGYVNTHFEFCELIKRGDMVYPAQYIGGGNYEPVLNNDVNGNSYLRKNGKTSFGAPPSKQNVKTKSCGGDDMVQMTIPFRLVMVVPKSKLLDNAFSDELLVQEINSLLSNEGFTPTGASNFEYALTNYDTDSLSIWASEVKGVDYQMSFDYSYIAIDFNAVVVANPACIYQSCGYGYSSGEVIYYGNSDSFLLNNSEIQGLISLTTSTFAGDYSFIATVPSEYKYIAIPQSLGTPLAFTDPSTGFNVSMNTVYQVIINSTTYNVYRTYYKLGGAITIRLT
jgi:hypothetical protein